MNFGDAIEVMKDEGRVARAGWNGKGMFLYLVGPGRYPPSTRAARMLAAEQENGRVPYAPYIAMKTVDGTVVPWLASQTDMLAEDWGVLTRVETVNVGYDMFDLDNHNFDEEDAPGVGVDEPSTIAQVDQRMAEEEMILAKMGFTPVTDRTLLEKLFGGNQEADAEPVDEDEECDCLHCTIRKIIREDGLSR